MARAMTKTSVPPTAATRPANTLPRLLPHVDTRGLGPFLEYFGARPRGDRALIAEVERAGLRGHGVRVRIDGQLHREYEGTTGRIVHACRDVRPVERDDLSLIQIGL